MNDPKKSKKSSDAARKALSSVAVDDSPDFYFDHDTGFTVFTKEYHLKRGYCCKSICRHCPWNYKGNPTDI